jgi:hypothetical protein
MWLLIDKNLRQPTGIPFTEQYLLFDDPVSAARETLRRGFDTFMGIGLQDPATMKVGFCQMYRHYPVDLALYRLEIQK